jgi:hypothetical protein
MGKIISITQEGDFKKTDRFLHRLIGLHYGRKLKHYGEKGVQALRAATPKDSGETAEAWSYEIVEEPGRTAVYWRNSHVVNGTNIAVILQYGHATRNGGFVEGIDYINPAIRPIFQQMAEEAWKEVVR